MAASTLVVGSNRGESQWGVAFLLLWAVAAFISLVTSVTIWLLIRSSESNEGRVQAPTESPPSHGGV